MFLELVTYGDLLGYLRKSRGEDDTYYINKDLKNPKAVDPQHLFSFALDVAKGMAFLAENKVTLRGLLTYAYGLCIYSPSLCFEKYLWLMYICY